MIEQLFLACFACLMITFGGVLIWRSRRPPRWRYSHSGFREGLTLMAFGGVFFILLALLRSVE